MRAIKIKAQSCTGDGDNIRRVQSENNKSLLILCAEQTYFHSCRKNLKEKKNAQELKDEAVKEARHRWMIGLVALIHRMKAAC